MKAEREGTRGKRKTNTVEITAEFISPDQLCSGSIQIINNQLSLCVCMCVCDSCLAVQSSLVLCETDRKQELSSYYHHLNLSQVAPNSISSYILLQ